MQTKTTMTAEIIYALKAKDYSYTQIRHIYVFLGLDKESGDDE